MPGESHQEYLTRTGSKISLEEFNKLKPKIGVFSSSGYSSNSPKELEKYKQIRENTDKMIKEKLGWPSAGIHSGRMYKEDYEAMRELMLHQPYIHSFEIKFRLNIYEELLVQVL
jgi:hypothetical protein